MLPGGAPHHQTNLKQSPNAGVGRPIMQRAVAIQLVWPSGGAGRPNSNNLGMLGQGQDGINTILSL